MNPYLAPARVRAALRSLQLHPTRDMGQNFLVDAQALASIVAAAGLAARDLVVEVGPGLGVLTWELLQRAGLVVAVELDPRLANRLRSEFAAEPRLHLLEGDILKWSPGALLAVAGRPGYSYTLVANLPYAITAPVLRHFLEADVPPQLMVVLVQWEVAERILARGSQAGRPRYSVLAHAIQFYAEASIVERIPAASFWPAPAVDTAILRLQRRAAPPVQVDDVDALFRIIKAGFLQSRKKLGNALPTGLAAMGERVSRETVQAALARAGVDAARRAETLRIEEWAGVYHEISGARGEHGGA
jgi:16S rRNA (adenine1518-N6/adenine1519-N6)-dimethyltransferase